MLRWISVYKIHIKIGDLTYIIRIICADCLEINIKDKEDIYEKNKNCTKR